MAISLGNVVSVLLKLVIENKELRNKKNKTKRKTIIRRISANFRLFFC